MIPRKSSRAELRILEIPLQKMAVVHAGGVSDEVLLEVPPALSGSVCTLRFGFGKKGMPTFKVSDLYARYPDAHLVPKGGWPHLIGLPVPEDSASLPPSGIRGRKQGSSKPGFTRAISTTYSRLLSKGAT
jgi:hypothetical protein